MHRISSARFLVCSLFVALSVAVGCQKSLKLADARSLKIGSTTEEDLRTKFGKPDLTRETDRDGNLRKTLIWRRSNSGSVAFVFWVDYTTLAAQLHNQKLAGWYFICSAKSQHTSADLALRNQIVKGKTNRSQLVALLGEPHGVVLHGTTMDEFKTVDSPNVSEMLVWFNAQSFEGVVVPTERKCTSLVVGLDKRGVVVTTTLEQVELGL